MQPVDERSERYVLLTERIVLECENCAERLVLFGTEEDWESERTVFECECGEMLTLQDRYEEGETRFSSSSTLTPEEDLTVRELLRQIREDRA